MSPAALPVEKVIRISGLHWIHHVIPVVVYVLLFGVSLLLFVLAGMAAHHNMWLSHGTFLAALLLMLCDHHWFFAFLMSAATEHIVVTDQRVIVMNTRLFLEDQMFEISFEKMKTVEGRKDGILQNVLRYGSLWFESGSHIDYVPHPGLFVKDIQQSMGRR